jgi:hypothetical protein
LSHIPGGTIKQFTREKEIKGSLCAVIAVSLLRGAVFNDGSNYYIFPPQHQKAFPRAIASLRCVCVARARARTRKHFIVFPFNLYTATISSSTSSARALVPVSSLLRGWGGQRQISDFPNHSCRGRNRTPRISPLSFCRRGGRGKMITSTAYDTKKMNKYVKGVYMQRKKRTFRDLWCECR